MSTCTKRMRNSGRESQVTLALETFYMYLFRLSLQICWFKPYRLLCLNKCFNLCHSTTSMRAHALLVPTLPLNVEPPTGGTPNLLKYSSISDISQLISQDNSVIIHIIEQVSFCADWRPAGSTVLKKTGKPGASPLASGFRECGSEVQPNSISGDQRSIISKQNC